MVYKYKYFSLFKAENSVSNSSLQFTKTTIETIQQDKSRGVRLWRLMSIPDLHYKPRFTYIQHVTCLEENSPSEYYYNPSK